MEMEIKIEIDVNVGDRDDDRKSTIGKRLRFPLEISKSVLDFYYRSGSGFFTCDSLHTQIIAFVQQTFISLANIS